MQSFFVIVDANFRNAEVEADDDLFIGPPPPALVAEAASANEAERFEEVYIFFCLHLKQISHVFQSQFTLSKLFGMFCQS